ncbi:MAG TPA: CsgG/HfaB family protein [Vicinamibacterales bacterium]|nr:CsgG/HfaB family protein [Vicinamibacterales bacterium]
MSALLCGVSLTVAVTAGPQDKSDKEKNKIDKCAAPYGTLAVNEPTDEVIAWLRNYKLDSPSALIRIYAQESNCFIVVERGRGMQNVQQERALGASGELQQGSNMGKGQMVAADYVLTPYVQFSDPNAGGGGAVVGGIGRKIGLGAVAGGLKFKEAQTSITLSSVRTSVQVAAAEGKAKQRDFSLGGLGIAGGLFAGAGAYSSTAEGKVIAASLLDNYNAIVAKVLGNSSLKPMAADRAAALATGEAPVAGVVFGEGDVIHSKIDGVKLMATASDASKVVATLKKSDELVIMGPAKDGYIKVLGPMGEGFVKTALIAK